MQKFCLNEFKGIPDSSVEFFFLFLQKQERNLNILLFGMIFPSYFLKHVATCKWQFRISIFLFFRDHLWKDSFSSTFLWCRVRCFYIKYFKYWSILDLFLQIFTCTAQTICLHIWRHVYIRCIPENFSFQMDCFYMLSIPKFEWLTCSK